jgi:hypothetical protein
MARKVSKKNLIKRLDSEFSKYIRTRGGEIAECFTCGKKDHWKNMDAGHFQSRRHYSTRWDETNVQVQCKSCNVFRQGEQYKFGLNLDGRFGDGTAERLEIKSKHLEKFSTTDLEELLDKYKKLNLLSSCRTV